MTTDKASQTMIGNLIRSILHNIGVLIVGFVFAFIGTQIDLFLGIGQFRFPFVTVIACLLLLDGFLLRVWATFYFYEQRMAVISLKPQRKLLTSGPYRFSRNPLYLGGNLFIFLGAVLLLGSPSGLVLTALNLIAVDRMIRREEKQLARAFGDEWTSYQRQTRRWL